MELAQIATKNDIQLLTGAIEGLKQEIQLLNESVNKDDDIQLTRDQIAIMIDRCGTTVANLMNRGEIATCPDNPFRANKSEVIRYINERKINKKRDKR